MECEYILFNASSETVEKYPSDLSRTQDAGFWLEIEVIIRECLLGRFDVLLIVWDAGKGNGAWVAAVTWAPLRQRGGDA